MMNSTADSADEDVEKDHKDDGGGGCKPKAMTMTREVTVLTPPTHHFGIQLTAFEEEVTVLTPPTHHFGIQLTAFEEMAHYRNKRECPKCGSWVQKLTQHLKKVHKLDAERSLVIAKTSRTARTSNRRVRRRCPVQLCLSYTAYLGRHLREKHGLQLNPSPVSRSDQCPLPLPSSSSSEKKEIHTVRWKLSSLGEDEPVQGCSREEEEKEEEEDDTTASNAAASDYESLTDDERQLVDKWVQEAQMERQKGDCLKERLIDTPTPPLDNSLLLTLKDLEALKDIILFRMDFPWKRMKLVANLMRSRVEMLKLCQCTSLVQLGTWVMDKWLEMFGVSAEEVFEGVFSPEYLEFEKLQHHVVVMAGVAGGYFTQLDPWSPFKEQTSYSDDDDDDDSIDEAIVLMEKIRKKAAAAARKSK